MKYLLFLAALVSLTTSVVEAKCRPVEYDITGIISNPDGAPVFNAEVTITLATVYGMPRKAVRTNVYGRYDAQIFYSPNDDLPNPDKPAKMLCTQRLPQVSVYVAAEGYESFAGNLPISTERVTANYSLKRTAAGRLR